MRNPSLPVRTAPSVASNLAACVASLLASLASPVAAPAAVAAAALAGLAACGPSAAELNKAKAARYQGDPATLFGEAKAAIEAGYVLAKADPAALGFQTEGKWYTPEGLADTRSGGDVSRLQDGSINLTLIVRLVRDGEAYAAQVEPIVLRLRKGNPNPDKLGIDDVSLPGWVSGKYEAAVLAVAARLAPYAVSGAKVPAVVPAGGAAPPAGSAAPAGGAGTP